MHNEPCFCFCFLLLQMMMAPFTLTECSSGGSHARVSRTENTWVELVFGGNNLAFFTGSKLSVGKLPLTVGADISSVTFKTKKPENQSEMEQASHQHAPGEIQKPSSVSGVFGCWASECARIQTQQAPVCFHSHGWRRAVNNYHYGN